MQCETALGNIIHSAVFNIVKTSQFDSSEKSE